MAINTKITLKVKNGPGEILGVTEVDTINGVADFSSIQFSEPGNYIVSVIPSNKDINPSEFTINILKEEEFISQEDSGREDKSINGNRPIITQILQPSIKVDPIEFSTSDSNIDNENIAIGLGYTPFVWYNGIQIRSSDISKLDLYYDNLIPKCKITLRDTFGLLNSPETMPLNNTKFEIFINSGSDILKSIHLRFKLEINQVNKNGTNTITGIIDIDELYNNTYASYTGTSFDALKTISSELGLGFNSNIVNTDDNMKWRRSGINTVKFINDIISHSYISDNSFLMGYIDFYWCFNYVDIEKEWKRDISSDVGLNTQGVSTLDKDKSNKLVPLVLSNDRSGNYSSFYFIDYKLNNNSTYQSTKKGTFSISKVYDRVNKQFLKFNIDSITTDDNTVVVLKGSPNSGDDLYENFTNNYGGKIDIDNVHPNYLYAIEQNNRNFDNLLNMSLEMTLPQPNYNLYKYQKIRIDFINQKQTVTNPKILDERLSGEWIILDISYSWRLGSLNQKLLVVRKELGKTTNEMNNEITKVNNKGNSELNENPFDDTITFGTQSISTGGGSFIFGGDDNSDLLEGTEFVESEFAGLDETSINEGVDNPTGVSDENFITSNDTNLPDFTSSLLKSVNRNYYIISPNKGFAGHRLIKIISDLEKYLSINGYTGVKLSNNGIMRDLESCVYPSNPARAKGSLHGAGLAIDLAFNIPGKQWRSINDNKNLASDTKLNKLIYNWVKSQKDIVWGGEWGTNAGTKSSDGIIKGWGIVEYHHFEIKASEIYKYLEPYKEQISGLGFDYRKVYTTTELQKLYIKLLNNRV